MNSPRLPCLLSNVILDSVIEIADNETERQRSEPLSINRIDERIVPEFSENAFVGTAQYYSQYRPPYPAELWEDLQQRTGLTGRGRLLDIGCGPGRVALALSPCFDEVWAIDPELEMIDEGRKCADGARNIHNIQWMTTRAEDLSAPDAFFDLVTIGEAFHRLDQPLIAKRVLGWLKHGCSIAILWQVNLWPGNQEWQRLAREITFTYARRPSGHHEAAPRQEYPSFEDALHVNGFESIATRDFRAPFVWTVDSMIGYLYSTSILSRRILGNRIEAFEKDFRRALLGLNPNGRFSEDIAFGYLAGSRPRT
jgi:SAM-dependent methyltransferase